MVQVEPYHHVVADCRHPMNERSREDSQAYTAQDQGVLTELSAMDKTFGVENPPLELCEVCAMSVDFVAHVETTQTSVLHASDS